MQPNSANCKPSGGIAPAEFVLAARRSHQLPDANDSLRSETASGQYDSENENLIGSAEFSGGGAA